MSRPDVAVFLPSLEGGGAERVSVDLAAALSTEHDVEVVLAWGEGPLIDQLPAEVPVVRLGARRTATSFVGLTRYLRRRRPRALLSAMTHTNVVASLAARAARTGTTVVVAEHVHLSAHTSTAPRRTDRLMPRFLRAAYRGRTVVAVSEGVADDVARRTGIPRRTIAVVPNPLPIDTIEARAAEPVTHRWFVDGASPPLVAVGRLQPQKDFETLLRALAIARNRRDDLRLVILGEGPERPSLEAEVARLGIGDAVELPGFVANPYPLMRAAAGVVLSSRWEGLPTVLLEALAVETPIVATDCPSGPAEILQGGRFGRLVPVGDPEALAGALVDLVEGGRSAPAAEEACARYRPDVVAAAYARLLGI